MAYPVSLREHKDLWFMMLEAEAPERVKIAKEIAELRRVFPDSYPIDIQKYNLIHKVLPALYPAMLALSVTQLDLSTSHKACFVVAALVVGVAASVFSSHEEHVAGFRARLYNDVYTYYSLGEPLPLETKLRWQRLITEFA